MLRTEKKLRSAEKKLSETSSRLELEASKTMEKKLSRALDETIGGEESERSQDSCVRSKSSLPSGRDLLDAYDAKDDFENEFDSRIEKIETELKRVQRALVENLSDRQRRDHANAWMQLEQKDTFQCLNENSIERLRTAYREAKKRDEEAVASHAERMRKARRLREALLRREVLLHEEIRRKRRELEKIKFGFAFS